MDQTQWPAMKDRARRDLQDEDPRRVVRADGGHRRVLRAGAVDRARRRSTRTTCTARPSSSATASCSRPRRRGSPRTPGAIQRPPAHAGQHTDEVLRRVGLRRRSCRQAPRRRRRRLTRGHPRLVPRPPGRRVDPDRRHDGQGRAGRPPGRPRRRHPGRARRGASTASSTTGETLGDRRAPRVPALGRGPRRRPGRVPRLRRLGDDRHAGERPAGLVLAGVRRRGGRAAGRDPPGGAGRRPHRLRQRRRLRAPRPHPGPPRRGAGRRAGRDAARCSRPR